jgi:cytochrome c oxidase cbb3-type subunit 3
MNRRAILLAASLAVTSACGTRDPVDLAVIPPNKIANFNSLYARNCAGCHGPDGRRGLAVGLGDPVYLAIADDAIIRRVTEQGIAGTAMPAFAQHSGGMLTDEQINVIIGGIRSRWGRPDVLHDANTPSYAAQSPGDAKRGAIAFGTYCSACHGADGRGGKSASSIVDGSYLALVSDQYLRTTVIVGRPELGAPDWRGDVPGKPMSPDDVSDVVAWLVAQRPQPYSTALQPGGIR